VFYISRDNNGAAKQIQGAWEFGTDNHYDLTLNQTGTPRFEFTYTDDKGNEQLAYWEPQTKYSRTFGKNCNDLLDAEKLDLSAVPPVDPKCRHITVITPKGAPAPAGKKTPGLEPALLLVALALVAVAMRRRK
jgi:hypothetical protein